VGTNPAAYLKADYKKPISIGKRNFYSTRVSPLINPRRPLPSPPEGKSVVANPWVVGIYNEGPYFCWRRASKTDLDHGLCLGNVGRTRPNARFKNSKSYSSIISRHIAREQRLEIETWPFNINNLVATREIRAPKIETSAKFVQRSSAPEPLTVGYKEPNYLDAPSFVVPDLGIDVSPVRPPRLDATSSDVPCPTYLLCLSGLLKRRELDRRWDLRSGQP
jgi:hypothetical protein